MRIVVLHSDVAEDAPPDEIDTIVTAEAVGRALEAHGHSVELASFRSEIEAVRACVADADAVFNMVESISGLGSLAPLAPAMLEQIGIPFTGCGSAAMALAGDKPLTKRILRAGGLPTANWSEPPDWENVAVGTKYVVKSATEDASLGLDDDAVVAGPEAMRARAELSAKRHGGRWFAEAYLEGAEFNVAVLEEHGRPRVLPIPEMRFENWPKDRPRIVGYAAKWDEGSADSTQTVRVFANDDDPVRRTLDRLARETWALLGMRGFARVDFRLDADGAPMILEINPNPCLEPNAGFASAAARAGIGYAELVARILAAAHFG